MSKLKILMILAAVLLITVPAGLAQAQEPEEEAVAVTIAAEGPTGTAVIWDDVGLSDAITFSMTNVPAPGEGKAYEGWLVSDNGSKKLSTGIMEVDFEGSINHTFTGTGENLIHNYDKVVITLEPVPDSDPGPSREFAFSHQIPAGGIAHIRHLLTNWPPGADKGILTNLKEQLDVAILHAQLAASSATLEDLRLHAHHVINVIEGEDGPNFDASSGNPGDGIGVLTHAQDRKHGPFAAAAAPDDAVIGAAAALVDLTGKNAEDWSILARDLALNSVLPESNLTLAKVWLGPGAGTVISYLEAARDGFDADNDGTIASTIEEGGAAQAYVEAQRMATYTLSPGGLAGGGALLPGVGLPGLPITGDPGMPRLAQIALIAGLVLLAIGGLVLVRTRRARIRA